MEDDKVPDDTPPYPEFSVWAEVIRQHTSDNWYLTKEEDYAYQR